jgi:hypothetical protein
VNRALLRVFVAAGFLGAITGCGQENSPPPPSALTGLIVEIEGAGSDVDSFTLEEAAGGETYEIRIASDVDYGFDLSHLFQHLNERLPVRCALEERDGDLYALEIVDA